MDSVDTTRVAHETDACTVRWKQPDATDAQKRGIKADDITANNRDRLKRNLLCVMPRLKSQIIRSPALEQVASTAIFKDKKDKGSPCDRKVEKKEEIAASHFESDQATSLMA